MYKQNHFLSELLSFGFLFSSYSFFTTEVAAYFCKKDSFMSWNSGSNFS